MLLGTLGVSLLGNLLTGRGLYRAGKGKGKGKGIYRTGKGKSKGIYRAGKGKGIVRAGYGNNSNNKMDF